MKPDRYPVNLISETPYAFGLKGDPVVCTLASRIKHCWVEAQHYYQCTLLYENILLLAETFYLHPDFE